MSSCVHCGSYTVEGNIECIDCRARARSNESAIDSLDRIASFLDRKGYEGLGTELIEAAKKLSVFASRKFPRWTKTAERLPPEIEENRKTEFVMVAARQSDGSLFPVITWAGLLEDFPEKYPYWTPMPEMPQEAAREETSA